MVFRIVKLVKKNKSSSEKMILWFVSVIFLVNHEWFKLNNTIIFLMKNTFFHNFPYTIFKFKNGKSNSEVFHILIRIILCKHTVYTWKHFTALFNIRHLTHTSNIVTMIFFQRKQSHSNFYFSKALNLVKYEVNSSLDLIRLPNWIS